MDDPVSTNSIFNEKSNDERESSEHEDNQFCDEKAALLHQDSQDFEEVDLTLSNKDTWYGSLKRENETETNDAPTLSSKETHDDEFSYSHMELRRKYRNAREKERSCLITQQIHELQRLLSLGGFLTPSKDSKSSILEKTAKYIKYLQQDQHESEIDRQRILNRLHAITTASERNVRSIQEQSTEDALLPNYYIHPSESLGYKSRVLKRQNLLRKTHDPDMHPLEDFEYHLIVEACSAGIAISSLGGNVIDCNERFCQLTNCTKEQLCRMTIFNFLDPESLDVAYDQLRTIITHAMIEEKNTTFDAQPYTFRGGMIVKGATLKIALVRGEDGTCKVFCVTIIDVQE